MRIIFMGTPEFALPTLKSVIESEHEVAGVLCQPDRPKGRGKKILMPAVKKLAVQYNLPVWQPEKPNHRQFVESISGTRPDLIVVAAYGNILRKRLLNLPTWGCINVHASLLPNYRGAAPIQRTLFAGEKQTGITIMQMDPGMDTGHILAMKKIDIAPDENSAELENRLARYGAEALMGTLSLLGKGEMKAIAQNHELATYAPKLTKEDMLMDWSETSENIHNRARGLAPKPGLKTFLPDLDLHLKIIRTSRPTQNICTDRAPGTIVEISKGQGLLIATGDGTLLIRSVHPQNRKVIDTDAFLRGYNINNGMVFNSLIKRGKQ